MLKNMIALKKQREFRGAARMPVKARARFREAGRNPFDVELHDLSSTGFRMITFSRPHIGSSIWVTLPGLQTLEAIIRRSQKNEFGCEFVQPLHAAVAEDLQNRYR
jgi:hypothetical protein